MKVKEVHDELVKLLPQARFVAIDCEFSGIGKRQKGTKDLWSHISALRQDSCDYALLQIGFCVVLYDEENEETPWSLYPYNMYTYPAEHSIFTFDSVTTKWLHDQGFDFNRWVTEGLPYRRLVDEDEPTPSKKHKNGQEEIGVQRIIDAIIYYRKPIVVHNGLLDVYHIYHKFIGALPTDPKHIVEEFFRLFSFGVLDTKNIANYLFYEASYRNLTSRHLGGLYEEFSSSFDYRTKTKICESACQLRYVNEETSALDTDRYHEAGFDATVTAMVFIAELCHLSKEEGNDLSDVIEAINGNHDRCGEHVKQVINCINIHDPIEMDFLNLSDPSKGNIPTKKSLEKEID